MEISFVAAKLNRSKSPKVRSFLEVRVQDISPPAPLTKERPEAFVHVAKAVTAAG